MKWPLLKGKNENEESEDVRHKLRVRAGDDGENFGNAWGDICAVM